MLFSFAIFFMTNIYSLPPTRPRTKLFHSNTQNTIMMNIVLILFKVTFLCLVYISYHSVHAFASWMTNDFCNRPLRVGEVIMNAFCEFDNSRKIIVTDSSLNVVIANNTYYTYGQQYTVHLDVEVGQFLFETNSPATFIGGGCKSLRIASPKMAKLQIPNKEEMSAEDISKPIIVSAGWALGHEAVKIPEVFVLLPPLETNSDSNQQVKHVIDLDAAKLENVREGDRGNTRRIESITQKALHRTKEYVPRHSGGSGSGGDRYKRTKKMMDLGSNNEIIDNTNENNFHKQASSQAKEKINIHPSVDAVASKSYLFIKV